MTNKFTTIKNKYDLSSVLYRRLIQSVSTVSLFFFLSQANAIPPDSCEFLFSQVPSSQSQNLNKTRIHQVAEVNPETLPVPISIDQENLPYPAMKQILKDHFSRGEVKSFIGTDNQKIRYYRFSVPNEKGVIALHPGLAEFSELYSALIRTLNLEGFSVYILDPRGQGQSGHLGATPTIVHVNDFEHYISDFKDLLELISEENSSKPVVLSNSMGGLVATQTLIKYPHLAEALIALVPAYAPQTHGIPLSLAPWIAKAKGAVQGANAAVTNSKSDYRIPANQLARFIHRAELTRENQDNWRQTPSNGWFQGLLITAANVRAHFSELAVPTLLISAGQDNRVRTENIASLASTNSIVSYLHVPQGKHSLLRESDPLRNGVMLDMLRFLSNPKRLQGIYNEKDLSALYQRSLDSLETGDIAFAHYQATEAMEIMERAKTPMPAWASLMTAKIVAHLANTQSAIDSATKDQKRLYEFLDSQRRNE